MQKDIYQVQQSTVTYCFSFQTLSNENMKMGHHAIFFLQRLNLIPQGYIVLEHTVSAEFLAICPKIYVNFQFVKKFITKEFRRKSQHFTLNA